jgi:hypothetical protein
MSTSEMLWSLTEIYNLIEGGEFVVLRLDYPGEGLSNDPAMMQLMQDMHLDSLVRYGSHPQPSP